MAEKAGIDVEKLIRPAGSGHLEPEDTIENLRNTVRQLAEENERLEKRHHAIEKELLTAEDEIDKLKTAVAAEFIDKWAHSGAVYGCGSCKFRKFDKGAQDWICDNLESDFFADFTICIRGCENWEGRNGHKL